MGGRVALLFADDDVAAEGGHRQARPAVADYGAHRTPGAAPRSLVVDRDRQVRLDVAAERVRADLESHAAAQGEAHAPRMRAELVARIARDRAGKHEVAADRLAVEPFGF